MLLGDSVIHDDPVSERQREIENKKDIKNTKVNQRWKNTQGGQEK